ncbi:hypothetical protein AAVH_14127 [Aphelenchoides avenae]|nr:hypothetical protein AAVH_14127 [Aphelenchus avenae]
MLLQLCVVAWIVVTGHCRLNGSVALARVPSRVINKTGIREMMGIPRSSHGGTGAELNDGNGAILQCHAFDSKDGVLLEDTLVKCDPSVKFCYTLVKTDDNDTATLKGCDGDPEYGLTANGKPATFCEKDGPVIVNIGTTNASLNCCDTAGCNAAASSTSGGGSGPKSDTGDSGDLRCHFYNSDSIKGVLVTDVMVKCDAAVRFCYKLVKTVGKETTTFKGCDGDPVYGLTVDGELTSFCLIDGPVIKKTGTTETNLNCCDTTGCNSASRFVFGFSSVLAIYVIRILY